MPTASPPCSTTCPRPARSWATKTARRNTPASATTGTSSANIQRCAAQRTSDLLWRAAGRHSAAALPAGACALLPKPPAGDLCQRQHNGYFENCGCSGGKVADWRGARPSLRSRRRRRCNHWRATTASPSRCCLSTAATSPTSPCRCAGWSRRRRAGAGRHRL